jgi:hypothetical protein
MTPKYVLSNCREEMSGDLDCRLRAPTYFLSMTTSICDEKAGLSGTVDRALWS